MSGWWFAFCTAVLHAAEADDGARDPLGESSDRRKQGGGEVV